MVPVGLLGSVATGEGKPCEMRLPLLVSARTLVNGGSRNTELEPVPVFGGQKLMPKPPRRTVLGATVAAKPIRGAKLCQSVFTPTVDPTPFCPAMRIFPLVISARFAARLATSVKGVKTSQRTPRLRVNQWATRQSS